MLQTDSLGFKASRGPSKIVAQNADRKQGMGVRPNGTRQNGTARATVGLASSDSDVPTGNSELAARHLEAVASALAETQRPSTRKAYAAAWNRFEGLGPERGRDSASRRPGYGRRLYRAP